MSLSPPEQHSLNQATLASVESTLSPSRPSPSSASASSSSSRAPPSNFTHSPGVNPLLQRGKLKKAPAKKKANKPKPAAAPAPVPESQLASAVEHAQEEELALLDEPSVDQEEAGDVINLADQLLAQLDAKDDLAPTSATVPEEAVSLSGNVSPKDSHHEHHSSLGEKIKGLGHDVKEAVKEVGTAGDRRPNRQQARKLRKQNGIAEAQAAARAEVAAENDRSVEEERLAIEAGCKKLGVRVKEIDPDGHCLFSSVADQANLLGLAPDSRKQTYVSARHGAAATMRANPDEFLPFLESEKEADGLMGQEEYARYCDTVENTGEWGGQPEIKALSKYYGAPVHVLQAGTDIVKVEDATLPPGRGPILISYHRKMYGLGEHYNSLVPAANPAANPSPTAAPVA